MSADDRSMRHRAALWTAWWLGFMVAWIALTGTLDVQELVAGAVCAATAATVAELVRVQDYRRFQPDPRWLLRLPRLVWLVIGDSLIVLKAIVLHVSRRRRIDGAFRAFVIDPGGDDGRSSAFRAVLTTAISMTPNTYVVGLDEKDGVVLVHQMRPVPRARTREDVLGKL